jgi:alpha-galactosidase
VIHLRGDGTDVVVDVSTGTPVIVHWGARLGDLDPTLSTALTTAIDRPSTAPMSLVPEQGAGFAGRPGLLGRRRGGTAWSPRFVADRHSARDGHVVVEAVDAVAALRLTATIELADALVVRVVLTNEGEHRYLLDALTVTLPVPQHAAELLTYTGRWTRELHPERVPWPRGAWTAENRRGRTSHEHPPLVWTGTPGFGEWHGEVWGVHLAWSANHVLLAERLPDGRRYLQLGELLQPGEIVLRPGDSYATPEIVAVHATAGLTPASWGFHRRLRARPSHPESPRPVLLNTWEAVYFDHRLDRLRALADAAAAIGVERFVLDDGWFASRRDDTSGLGDWVVSADVYPGGLSPLIDHVRGLGMEFGIWVEPEMVSPDSDVYRAHPEWALATDGYEAPLVRHQLVLDLANPGAYAHVFGQLDALLNDHDIAFVKWDMNRDHIQGSGYAGAAGTHAQTLALYGLLDELRAAHPLVEFESCSSGGGRIDHEILRRTERAWTSDCNDALERQMIQRGVSMFVPPELMGAHIGPARSHTTGRVHSLAFRAATAIFGHLGVECDVVSLSEGERDELADAIALHRRLRPLLHSGDVVRFDTEDSYCAHGVYAADRSEGVVSFAVLRSAASLTPPPLQLPGLDPDQLYEIRHLPLAGDVVGAGRARPAWLDGGVRLTGRQLAVLGVQPPSLHPERAVLFHITAV